MFRKGTKLLHAMLDDLAKSVAQLDRRTERIEVIMTVREPSSTAAGEAYEGLRRQVVAAVSERGAHLSQLVQLAAALEKDADAPALRRLLGEWMEQASLRTVTGPVDETLFDIVEDNGGEPKVLAPAYVDEVTARVVRRGRAVRTEPAEVTP